jgi:hypothetical protein
MTGSHAASTAFQGARKARRQLIAVSATVTEGFRLMGREPASVLAWTFLWLATFTAAALLVAFWGPRLSVGGSYRTLEARFGPFAIVIIPGFLLVWAVTTVAAFRACLRPDERRFFYLRIGADEVRLAVMTVVGFVLILVFGGVPAYLLLSLATPIIYALPGLAKYFAGLGAAATIIIDIWIGVRLSLIAVETMAEGRFHLTAYWPLTRGRFWYLFFVYVGCFLVMFLFGLIVYFALQLLEGVALGVIGRPHGADPTRRAALLALAGGLAVLASLFVTFQATLFCAAQAHAFRDITGVHRRRMF